MNHPPSIRDRVPAAAWETFRQCRFVCKIFHPYACLLMRGPLNEEGAHLWAPFRGQPFDPAVYELVPDGWDHEHCDVCNTRINDGDEYWANTGPEHVDLCIACCALVQQELQAQ